MQRGRKLKFTQKYKQGKLLGQGVSGTVFMVEKIANDEVELSPPSSPSKFKDVQPQFFAAKHISLNTIDLQMAKKELKILQKLKHLSIVRVFEDYIQNDELIIIMQYCEGKDLQYLIQDMKKKGKYFNQSLVSTWIFQLILALQYIHSKDIVHRDIKPQNIFVDQKMNIKIGDFGVSKLLDGTENCKTTAGSPLYCSPEVMQGNSYSKKTDVWSLGCVIYQICTLQAPFSGKKGLLDLMVNIKNTEPKSIPKIYSADLNKLIRKMLLKDQKKRPSSSELLQDSILVQLMINYSSQINLKQEYEKKPIDKPSFSESFIDAQSNAVVEKMKKFEQQVKMKIESMKNKKVSSRQIDNYYLEIQNKMKALQKVVSTAFKQLKTKQEGNQLPLERSLKKSQVADQFEDSNNNSSRLSESQATIKSVNLGSTMKKGKMEKSSNFEKKQTLDASGSIDSVNSIFVKSNKKNFQIRQGSSLGLSSKTFQSVDLSSSINKRKVENVEQLQSTVKSEFLETIKSASDPNKMKTETIHHIDLISKEIANNPSLILDQTFLNVTLSLSNNDYEKFNMKKKNVLPQASFDKSYCSSSNTINFELSKRGYDESLSFSVSNKNPMEKKKHQSQKDSLEEQYEPDFDEYEEDKQMDIRQQQKKSVKDLFASTLKNLSLSKTDSNNSSEVNPRNKYSLTLSTIREQSSEGGSTISFQDS